MNQSHFLRDFIEDYKNRVYSLDFKIQKAAPVKKPGQLELDEPELTIEEIEEQKKNKKTTKLLKDIVRRTQLQKDLVSKGELLVTNNLEELETSLKEREKKQMQRTDNS